MPSLPPALARILQLPEASYSLSGPAPDLSPGLHLALGIFDGLHRGHQVVLCSAKASASEYHGDLSGVLTFSPHPSKLFRPEAATRLLMPESIKTQRIHQLGLPLVIWKRFEPGFAAIPAEEFIPFLKQHLPTLRSLHVGANFRFGKQRLGDVELLQTTASRAGVQLKALPRKLSEGEPISSSRIRACLEAGDMETTAALLGYPYFAQGQVVPGRQLGRTIGFPTLNLDWQPEARPPYGVYIVQAELPGPSDQAVTLPAIANYGLRPTVDDAASAPRLEVHLLSDLAPSSQVSASQLESWKPGCPIKVEWLTYLRPEQRFSGLDALQAQIQQDVSTARSYWQERLSQTRN